MTWKAFRLIWHQIRRAVDPPLKRKNVLASALEPHRRKLGRIAQEGIRASVAQLQILTVQCLQ
jgi:hypothetical protein